MRRSLSRLVRIVRPTSAPASWAPLFALAGSADAFGSPVRRDVPLTSRLFRTVRDIYALARHAEPGAGHEVADDTSQARAEAAIQAWRDRAEAAEQRLARVETRLAEAETTVLDLRSRLVCLQGKLAATHATARYQSLAQALEHGVEPRAPHPSLTDLADLVSPRT